MNFSMDYHVFTYLVMISVGSGILFGLAPALRLARVDVNTSLKDGGRSSSTGARGKYLSSILVIAEVALAVVLLAGAGLMVLLRDLHGSGATICMVTHDERYAHHAARTMHLFDGRIVQQTSSGGQVA
jgi:hypothetical protein